MEVIEFTPRPYQVELYKTALNRNTIVCLGTGTGKTFIAILLMKDPKFAQQLKGSYTVNAKRTVFLVPTRPLVKQQAAEIRRHFDVKVGEYTGDMNVDFWKKDQWIKELIKNEVIVMTPQIFLNMLNHNFIKFDKINLIIFDEVHWAAKRKGKKESGHPYKQIMNIYNSKPQSIRPRVLGLSASLINSSMRPELFDGAIKDLEDTYDSVCNTSNVAQMCGTNPEEVIWSYFSQSSSPNNSAVAVVKALQNFITNLRQINDNANENISMSVVRLKKCLVNIRNMLADPEAKTIKNPEIQQENPMTMTWMGIWCANIAIDLYIEEMTEYYELYKNLNPNHAQLLELVINFMKVIQKVFAPELKDPFSPMNTASPKMHRLLELLTRYKPIDNEKSELCAIVFVNQRSVAKVLCEWLYALKKLYPNQYNFLNAGWVVGHSARPGFESLVTSYSDRKQQEIIQKFRNEELNLLIATSVLEEGLDVRQCNNVIRYDKPRTFREYLQSKGRARASGAFYYMMTSNEDSAKLLLQLNSYRQMEEKIKNLNQKQYPNKNGTDSDNNSSDEEYKVPDGDARITTRSAIALLYRYCQKLPSDSFTKLIPNFEIEINSNKFRCTVRLPVNCPIKQPIIGEFRKKKASAKKNAALKACKQLHECGEFDDHFLPISREKFIEKYVKILGLKYYDNISGSSSGQKAGIRNRNQIFNKKLAQVFSKSSQETNTYFLHHIPLQYELIQSLTSHLITFGAITSKQIVNKCSFPVFVKSGRVEVDFVPLNAIEINDKQKKLIENFHSYTFTQVLGLGNSGLRFSRESPFSLLVVPMNSSRQIDWNFIEFISEQNEFELKPVPINERLNFEFDRRLYEDCVFTPWYRNDITPQFYNVIKITDLNPKSAFSGSKKYDTYEHYFREEYNVEICNKNQLLIEGKQVQNFAQIKWFVVKKQTAKAMDQVQNFVPELVTIHPFPSSLWRQALCLPAILYRLNYLFLAEELRQTIRLETKPNIGFLEPFNNKLNLDSETPLEDMDTYERDHSFDECDDGCDGHPFDSDFDSDPNGLVNLFVNPLKKKPRNDYSVIRIESDSRRSESSFGKINSIVNRTNINSVTDIDINSLLEMTDVLINQFNVYFERSKNAKHSNLNGITFDQMDSETKNAIQSNCPPSYGSAFPFIFSGDIESSIRETYDAKNEDPIRGPTADLLLNALTLLNANDGFNLERLETIGDSFLKFVTTANLYYSCPELDEGRLSYLRSIQICNCNLYHIGREKEIVESLVATKFYPKQNWLPPNYQTYDDYDCKLLTKDELSPCLHLISDKSIADSVEALIGAHLLSGGNKSAIIFMQWLGFKVSPIDVNFESSHNNNGSNIWRWLPLPESPIIKNSKPDDVVKGLHQDYNGCNLDNFEQIIGYEFKDKAFLVQALTHSSYFHNTITDCYQRLEFLGDAVLDYLITRHIFRDEHQFSPGELTDLRSALVNNSFFASIAVKFNFHKYLKVLSPDLFRAIERFVKRFEDDKVMAIKNCFSILNDSEVFDLEEVEVPKALGDVFESVAGAIFLDSGLSLDVVWNVFYKMLKPEIDYFSENVPKMPVRELREKYPSVSFSEAQLITGRKIRIVASVNGKEYSGVGLNKKFAKTAASKCALRALKSKSKTI